MNPPNQNGPRELVSRRLANQHTESRPLSEFRSWREQAARKSALPNTKATDEKLRRRYYRPSIWYSRDFRVVLALTATAILAAIIYYSMGS